MSSPPTEPSPQRRPQQQGSHPMARNNNNFICVPWPYLSTMPRQELERLVCGLAFERDHLFGHVSFLLQAHQHQPVAKRARTTPPTNLTPLVAGSGGATTTLLTPMAAAQAKTPTATAPFISPVSIRAMTKTNKTKPAPTTVLVINPATAPTDAEVKTTLQTIGKGIYNAVKVGPFRGQTLQIAELAVPDISLAMAEAMMTDMPTSNTTRMIKWPKITHDKTIAALLQTERWIHPIVQSDGTKKGASKKYAWASYESLEVKYDKSKSVLTFKVKAKCVGTGLPADKDDLVAYSQGKSETL